MNKYDDHCFNTIGVELFTKEITIGRHTYTLQIWDTAGQERFKSLRTAFYRGCDICLLAYSVDDRSSFLNLASWKREFLQYAEISPDSVFSFVIIGTKIDVDGKNREVSEAEAIEWCQNQDTMPYVETSAKRAINVTAAFETAVDLWAQHEEALDNHQREFDNPTTAIHLTDDREDRDQNSFCCSAGIV
ncbi:hypothetical protein AAG570_011220 [Ranatra chinensis]|uniref:Uncharacterized protein n=1 Tax=Ranatra chinensis TaxID=642074 RepID=A0ABD0YK04_9HEMI